MIFTKKEIEKLVLVLMRVFVCGSRNLAENTDLIRIRTNKAAIHAWVGAIE